MWRGLRPSSLRSVIKLEKLMDNNTGNNVEETIEKVIEITSTDAEVEVKKANHNKKYVVLMIIFIFIFLASGGLFAFNKYKQAKAEAEYAALLEKAKAEELAQAQIEAEAPVEEVVEEAEEVATSLIPDYKLDWDAILAENQDIYAWIVVPGTNIDYPVLSSGLDKATDFYLDHNLDGSYGPYPGCIYSQNTYNNTNFLDFNLVLYGHNMKNGTMFAGLHKYEDMSFFEENTKIYVYTPEMKYEYEIFAAYPTDDMLLFEKYNYSSDFGKIQYLDEVLAQRSANAHIREDLVPTYEDKIITLSTCIAGQDTKRWMVQGLMINAEECE